MKNFKLCYIDGATAYFTTQELSVQWGDDWDDVPYEHNAGRPYEAGYYHYSDGRSKPIAAQWNDDGTPKWEIYTLKFDAGWRLETPASHHYNSPYSVNMINAGAVAWLSGTDTDGKPIAIEAGASIEEFKQKVRQCGGKIYVLEE